MLANMSALIAGDNMAYANLLLQITFFAFAAIALANCFKNNAVARYSILYSSLMSLALMCIVSIAIQAKSSSLLLFQLSMPSDYFGQLLPQLNLNNLFLERIDPVSENSIAPPAIAGVSAAGQPGSFFASALYFVTSLPLYLVLQIIWVGGFLLSTVGLLRSLHNADRIAGRSLQLKGNEHKLLTAIMREQGLINSSLQCRMSVEIDSPVLVGIVNPLLIVPDRFFERFSESDIRAILRHELAHVTRRDSVFNFVQKTILSIFWFHPLVHHMDRLIMRAREEICDNYVLAEEPATAYGEVLLRLNTSQLLNTSQEGRVLHPSIVLGIVSSDWNLEQRIGGLLNQEREKLMQLSQKSKLLLNASVLAAALTLAACQVTAQDGMSQTAQTSGTGQIQSSDNGVSLTLGPEVVTAISEIQDLMTGGTDSEPDWEAAKASLDRLYEARFERMNDFEKSTVLNFYTNYYLSQENYEEAVRVFEQMLTIERLRPDIRARVHRSLGQLYAALENWSASIHSYEQWRAVSATEDKVVAQGLSYAHYQLEQFDEAVPNWKTYMELKQQNDEELLREDFAYLNGLYFTLEDWGQALELTKEMILQFNSATDWENLRAIYRRLDEAAELGQIDAA